MPSLLERIKRKITRQYQQRALVARHRRSAQKVPVIPEPLVWQFPADFTIREIGETGVRLADNFCTPSEAEALIQIGRETVSPSTVIGPGGKSIRHDYRTSSDVLIKLDNADPLIQKIAYRAASLLGLPVTHAEPFSLTCYKSTEYYKAHMDHDGSLKADRLYTALLYLNDLTVEEGGGTLFEKLNLVTQPVRGRAVFWVNSDRNKNALEQTLHSALPITSETAEKWVAQMWFRSYKISDGIKPTERVDVSPGKPLVAGTDLPRGIAVHS